MQHPSYPLCLCLLAVSLSLANISTASADPCGMVPPADIPLAQQNDQPPITRVGAQKTYVFYKDGIETFVIRPGFEGKIDEFGMLIPFPAPPEIRKVPENVFAHIAAAIDPPEVALDLQPRFGLGIGLGGFGGGLGGGGAFFGGGLGIQIKPDEVRVVREEAIGMYEVAVLAAGSAAALKKWMDEHGYRFPDGMEEVCNDYIRQTWGFVAVKSKVGRKVGVDPKPGMRRVNSKLPAGATFDGHVQAMGFRFRTKQLEVPMRLSAFNQGELHNIIYLLTDDPAAIRSISRDFVVRQIPGLQLKRNMLEPLPLRVTSAIVKGGRITNLTKAQLKSVDELRDPTPKNGIARELFQSDLLAVRHNRLSHPSEAAEKQLTQISERLGLRGEPIDKMTEEAATKTKDAEAGNVLNMLNRMTLTVIDGDFPRHILARKNLTFYRFKMRTLRNTSRHYDAKLGKGAEKKAGLLLHTAALPPQPARSASKGHATASNNILPIHWTAALFLLIVAGVITQRRRRQRAQ